MDFKDRYKACRKCVNCKSDVKVFGCGNKAANIAVIGDSPSKEDVINGEPFTGSDGLLLNDILIAIGIKREDLYFTNAILCRTDDHDRTPTKLEYTNCRDRLFEELNIIQPKATLLVGSTALKTVRGNDYKISDCHAEWFTTFSNPCFFYFPIMHPAWILHSNTEAEKMAKKKTMWQDIKKFKAEIDIVNQTFCSSKGVVNENK